jgi:mannose-1-phosphate guanylyltransferase/mannose-1-phosphate guanylyltransferase/mannose-6-phosphate isomerase
LPHATIRPVILSGGAGIRLWPLSTPERPKQLLALAGERTMLQMAAQRVCDESLFEAPWVVTSARLADEIEAQFASCGLREPTLILEPAARNTAPAVALAALEAAAQTLLLVMPSDHLIRDTDAYIAAVTSAAPHARDGWMVTFGIAPDRPETGYGYIKRGAPLSPGLWRAERFVEKPDLETAQAFLAGGGHDWNGGIFLFSAGAYVEALERFAPDILASVRQSLAGAARDGRRISPDAAAFAACRSQSIDHAVMEHSDRIAVAPVSMGWSDLGSWDSLYETGAPDGEGNVLAGEVLALDARDCLLRSEGPLLVAIGVEDVSVIVADGAVLVVKRGQAQRVKEALGLLDQARAARGSGPQ